MLLGTLVVFSLFAAQLLRIQGFEASALAERALNERTGKEVIPGMRGQILASDGAVLAASVERRTVTVDQQAVCTYGTRKPTCADATAAESVQKAATVLAPLIERPVADVVADLTGTARYKILAKNVSALNWNKIQDLGIPGIFSERTSDRVYPQSTTAASLVGFLSGDGKPGGGVEYQMDAALRGQDGLDVFEQSATGNAIPDAAIHVTPPKPGRDVTLTIDSSVQWYAQNALAQKVQETQALSGTVVVQEVKTGRLLAVASYPTYDPNNYGKATGSLSNLAFTDVFEPGSTGKVITVAAAMAEGKVTPMTPIVIPGVLRRADRVLNDSHPHGTLYLTAAGSLAESSNIGTMLIGETVSSKTLETYMRSFGLGSTSGSQFPGESRGLLAKSEDWNGSQRYTVMFGQGVSVTAIQAASVYQTIANGGVRLPATLIQSVENADGTMAPAKAPTGTRVIPQEIAAQMSQMLEGVVSDEGTAPKAQIPGYRVAGKTGTADRAVHGGYSGKTASFIGYAPADDPEIVVAVILQRPIKSYYGGTVAAPVFHDVMTYALQELKVPPTGTKSPSLKIKLDAPPAADEPGVLRDRRSTSGG